MEIYSNVLRIAKQSNLYELFGCAIVNKQRRALEFSIGGWYGLTHIFL